MCVDYTDLNKACPKYSYTLPNINHLVDNASGFGMLSFGDAFSEYNQVKMHLDEEEKMAFITNEGLYCYWVMPFRLKNAGATYQRMMNTVFFKQIRKNMKVYVDDILIKCSESQQHQKDLEETFKTLRWYNMWLNPKKCVFDVKAEKFLGFMLIERGIEANPTKCRAIIDMKSPTNIKEVQVLNGRLVVLTGMKSKKAGSSSEERSLAL